MKLTTILNNCWRRLLPTLAVLFVPTLMAQGIIYVHAPLSNTDGAPNRLPWDSLGTQVGADFPIVINGQTVLTLTTPQVLGQPASVLVRPSSTCAIIGQQPFLDFPDNVWAVPLSAGQEIGSSAASYNWFGSSYGTLLLSASIGSDDMSNPFLTAGYFVGVESAYFGFDFQQGGETYYGWVRVGCPVVGLNTGWIYDYAYETSPNTAIAAGAVPEPATWALLLIGTAFAFSRRKSAN